MGVRIEALLSNITTHELSIKLDLPVEEKVVLPVSRGVELPTPMRRPMSFIAPGQTGISTLALVNIFGLVAVLCVAVVFFASRARNSNTSAGPTKERIHL